MGLLVSMRSRQSEEHSEMPAVTRVVLQSTVQKQPCGHTGFLMMMHKSLHFCARPGTLALCSTAAEQEGNARAVSVVGELALPVWFHCASLADVRTTADVQHRAAEVTCCFLPFTFSFLLTPELPKHFCLR